MSSSWFAGFVCLLISCVAFSGDQVGVKEAVIQSNPRSLIYPRFHCSLHTPTELCPHFPAFSQVQVLSLCPRQALLINHAHSTSPQHKPALRSSQPGAHQPLKLKPPVTFHSTNCPVCASPETRGKRVLSRWCGGQAFRGSRASAPLSCSEPQELGQEMGVGELRVGGFPRPGDLCKPPHPSHWPSPL